jgi:hypothetical protein
MECEPTFSERIRDALGERYNAAGDPAGCARSLAIVERAARNGETWALGEVRIACEGEPFHTAWSAGAIVCAHCARPADSILLAGMRSHAAGYRRASPVCETCGRSEWSGMVPVAGASVDTSEPSPGNGTGDVGEPGSLAARIFAGEARSLALSGEPSPAPASEPRLHPAIRARLMEWECWERDSYWIEVIRPQLIAHADRYEIEGRALDLHALGRIRWAASGETCNPTGEHVIPACAPVPDTSVWIGSPFVCQNCLAPLASRPDACPACGLPSDHNRYGVARCDASPAIIPAIFAGEPVRYEPVPSGAYTGEPTGEPCENCGRVPRAAGASACEPCHAAFMQGWAAARYAMEQGVL